MRISDVYVKDCRSRVTVSRRQCIDQVRVEDKVWTLPIGDREKPADDAGNPLPRRSEPFLAGQQDQVPVKGNVWARYSFNASPCNHPGVEASQVFDICVSNVRGGSTDCVTLKDDAEVIQVIDVLWRQSDHDGTAPRRNRYQTLVAQDAECLANRTAADTQMGRNLFLDQAYPGGQVTHQDCGSQDG